MPLLCPFCGSYLNDLNDCLQHGNIEVGYPTTPLIFPPSRELSFWKLWDGYELVAYCGGDPSKGIEQGDVLFDIKGYVHPSLKLKPLTVKIRNTIWRLE